MVGGAHPTEGTTMNDLTEQSLETFLDAVAKRGPTPGGGSVTATAGALAASLARMAVAYSVGSETVGGAHPTELIESVAAQLRRVDQRLRALITQDAEAYAAMTATAKAAKATPGGSPEQAAHDHAVMGAIAVPMETAALASQALSAMDDVKEITNPYLLSDLGVAATLAGATVRAARLMVLVNAPEVRNATTRAKLLADIDAVVEHGAAHAESIESRVSGHLENGLAVCR